MDDKSLFKEILMDLISSNYDDTSTKDEGYAKQLIAIHSQFVKRNTELTKLLSNYIIRRDERVKTNAFFKKFLFWTFVGLLVLLTLTIVIVFIKVDLNNITNTSSVVGLVSVIVTYLTSMLSIFNIMSKYLFPSDEEKDAIDMISTVISNDLKVEEIMTNAIDNNNNSNLAILNQYKELLDNGIITTDEFEKIKNKIISKYIDENND